jgi:oxygen-independent coproporphyrinogen-3 oxidase
MNRQDPVAVYVHSPFCPTKCGYCDFNSFALDGEIVERTCQAMEREIRNSLWPGRPAKTIYFGGGTPTFMTKDQIVRLVRAVQETHPPILEAEITSEANPGTVDASKFRAMREAGFNRLSLGIQSFRGNDLRQLGRVHNATEAISAFQAARREGFDNLSLDLMFGLPGQSLSDWQQNLKNALTLRPDHVSLYGLTIESGTRFHHYHQRGQLDLPEDDTMVAMYDAAVDACEAAGLPQYEISNFARPGHESRHNLCYWRGEDYLAYGPGAVGCFHAQNEPYQNKLPKRLNKADFAVNSRVRYTNLKHPELYCAAVEKSLPLWCDAEALTPEIEGFERLMLGIRLNEGLPVTDKLKPEKRRKLEERGWIESDPRKVKLTRQGRHFASEVAVELG